MQLKEQILNNIKICFAFVVGGVVGSSGQRFSERQSKKRVI